MIFNAATQDQLELKADKTDISSPYKFKGSCTYANLPSSGNVVNDTYYVTDQKCKYTWNGKNWYQSSLNESDYEDEFSEFKTEVNTTVNTFEAEVNTKLSDQRDDLSCLSLFIGGSSDCIQFEGVKENIWTDGNNKFEYHSGTKVGYFKINNYSDVFFDLSALTKDAVVWDLNTIPNTGVSVYSEVTAQNSVYVYHNSNKVNYIALGIPNGEWEDIKAVKMYAIPFESNLKGIDDMSYKDKAEINGLYSAGYINENGELVNSNTYYATDFYDCRRFATIVMKLSASNGNFAFYDEKKNVLKVIPIQSADDYTINVPANSRFFRATRTNWEINNSKIYGYFKLNYLLENAQNPNRIYKVEKDGSGDFTRLTDALIEAEKYMNSTIYLGDGDWDLIEELGSSYIETIDGDNRGLYLKNGVHIIGSSRSKILCKYQGSTPNVVEWLTAFNAGNYGFILENVTIETAKCRYTVHDEMDYHEIPYVNKYIGCHFIHDNSEGGASQCIGGGLGRDGYIVIENCTFENLNTSATDELVSYHNTWYHGGTGKSHIEAHNNLVKGNKSFRFSWFGDSTEMTVIKCSNNSLGKDIVFRQETTDPSMGVAIDIVNMELNQWNNYIRTN